MELQRIEKNGKYLTLHQGDITKQEVDVIVNAANSNLVHGGGVARAIANAAGEELQNESRNHPNVPTGQVGVTKAGNLKAKIVIHAVGPIWKDGKSGEAIKLKSVIRNSLIEADRRKMTSIAFPAISTGIYSYPLKEAAQIILSTIYDELEKMHWVSDVRVVLFSDSDFEIFSNILSTY